MTDSRRILDELLRHRASCPPLMIRLHHFFDVDDDDPPEADDLECFGPGLHASAQLQVWMRLERMDGTEDCLAISPDEAAIVAALYPEATKWMTRVRPRKRGPNWLDRLPDGLSHLPEGFGPSETFD